MFDKKNYSKNLASKTKSKNKTDLNHDSMFNFNKYRNNEKCDGLSFKRNDKLEQSKNKKSAK